MATRHPEPSFAISFTSFPLFIMIRPSSLGCQLWAASCSLASQWPPSMNTNLRRHLFVLWSILLARSWLILLCSFFHIFWFHCLLAFRAGDSFIVRCFGFILTFGALSTKNVEKWAHQCGPSHRQKIDLWCTLPHFCRCYWSITVPFLIIILALAHFSPFSAAHSHIAQLNLLLMAAKFPRKYFYLPWSSTFLYEITCVRLKIEALHWWKCTLSQMGNCWWNSTFICLLNGLLQWPETSIVSSNIPIVAGGTLITLWRRTAFELREAAKMTSPGACSITEKTSIHYLVSSVQTDFILFDLIKLICIDFSNLCCCHGNRNFVLTA